ncbi:MAG TPA: HAD-IA family hydrolase [Caldimonas sp.]|jgi:phosphoglycolate phosphatase|nr:HAD-IA family hydrolase [Caldimonas sp.]HEX2540619.1 HAD-IA family hydrolase [Caldimonas sp.]
MTGARPTLLSFDLDGTLVDTASEIAEAANLALGDVGLAAQPPATIERFIGAGTRELMRRLLRVASDAASVAAPSGAMRVDTDQALARFAVHYDAVAGSRCRPYQGCIETLQRLRGAGIRLACLTNKDERFSRRILAAVGIDACFDVLVGGDTLGVRKPDARVVAHVLEVLRGEASALAHVGDSATDVLTARNAGILAWAVPYGYNGGEPVENARPDRLFASLPDVADFVLDGEA